MTDPTNGTEEFLEAAKNHVDFEIWDELGEKPDFGDMPNKEFLNNFKGKTEEINIIHRDFLRYRVEKKGFDPSSIRFTYPSLSETLLSSIVTIADDDVEYESTLAAAIGRCRLYPVYISPKVVSGLVNKIPLLEGFRVFLYDQLSAKSQLGITRDLKKSQYRELLNIKNPVSQSTINRFLDRFDEILLEYLQAEIEVVAEEAQAMDIARISALQ